MEKRRLIFGTYDTAAKGWTLASWRLAAAVQKTTYVDKPSGDGTWDLSTALTDGLARYNDRTLTATFECSEGDRMTREALIREMVNQLDGFRLDIELPDDPEHYVNGRLHVKKDYNDLAHGAVTVTATCEPWKYAKAEKVITLDAVTAEQDATLTNAGRRATVPVLTVEGSGASVRLVYGTASKSMSVGTYQWPTLLLTPGDHKVTFSGKGRLVVRYREAVLE